MKNTMVSIGISLTLLNAPLVFGLTSETRCGDSAFVVKSNDTDNFSDAKYTVYYKLGKKDKLLYEAYADKMYAACVEGYDNKKYLLLELLCAGSGCSEIGEFRIVDTFTKKILLDEKPITAEDKLGAPSEDGSPMHSNIVSFNHEKRNHKDAKKILGYNPPKIRYIKTFCCS